MTSVLWYSNETPDVGGQGGQRRQYFQVRSLVEAGHDVTVVSLAGEQDDTSIRALTEVRRLPRPGRWTRFGWPGGSAGKSGVLDVACDRVVVAHIESWLHLRQRRLRLADRAGRPGLLDLHNVFSAWYDAQDQPRLSERWRRLEAAAAYGFDAVSVCSVREQGAWQRSTDLDAMVLPHGVEPTEWKIEPRPRETPVLKLFGNWDWDPNRNGLTWFLERVVPPVAATGVRVEVAGRGTEGLSAGEAVRFMGRVDDLPAFLSDAWVVAMPVKLGVGAPVKFAEGLVTGVPLLATVDAADGDEEPGLLVSDDPRAWAEWVTQLVRNPERIRASARERRALALVERSWDRTTEPLRHWVEHP